jgi:hypothetical protein
MLGPFGPLGVHGRRSHGRSTRSLPRSLLLPFLLYACSDGGGDALSPDAGADASVLPGAGASGTGNPALPTFPKPCADLYDEALLPRFDLAVEPEHWRAIREQCDREYHPARFSYQGESADVMIRSKGNWSYRCDRPQFVVSFNETDKDARFHGVRKLMLDSAWYDRTLLRERLASFYMQLLEVPTSCVNNARLFVNGELQGLYYNVERLDREYLERNFEDPSGDLWDEGEELKTNEDMEDRTRIDRFHAARDVAALEAIVDLDHALLVWAGSAMLPDRDSFWSGVEINYYLYDHPTRGFLFLPYDQDLAFASPEETTQDFDRGNVRIDPLRFEHPEWRREPQVEAVLGDRDGCARFVEAMRRAHAAYDVPAMQRKLDAWATQIADAVMEDSEKPFTDDEHRQAVRFVRELLPQRKQFITDWLRTASCPVP